MDCFFLMMIQVVKDFERFTLEDLCELGDNSEIQN